MATDTLGSGGEIVNKPSNTDAVSGMAGMAHPAASITFSSKQDYEASDDLIKLRNEQKTRLYRSKTYDLMWHTVDLSPKLYVDQAAAAKKQEYRAIRSVNVANAKTRRQINEAMRRQRSDMTNNKVMDLASMLSTSGSESRIHTDDAAFVREKSFQLTFRPLTPNQDRSLVARSMELTEKKDMYRNPLPHDFRGVCCCISLFESKLSSWCTNIYVKIA